MARWVLLGDLHELDAPVRIAWLRSARLRCHCHLQSAFSIMPMVKIKSYRLLAQRIPRILLQTSENGILLLQTWDEIAIV